MQNRWVVMKQACQRIFAGRVLCRRPAIVFLCAAVGLPASLEASPTSATNPVVQFGSGTVSGLGTPQVTVNQTTPSLGINWTSLGNNAGEVLKFVQPSASAIALNRVVGTDPSQFLGSLAANGSVIVINPNGVFFGPGSQVNVNGLIASSLNITDTDFLNGRYAFQGTAANGMVQNQGQITAGPFGVYLLAPNVTNNGVITSPSGHIALAAGTTAYLSNRADGRGFLIEVTAPAGEALNLNRLIADGGQVSMIGRLVTQSGVVQANSVRKQNGIIKLVASDQATLRPTSRTIADGGEISISGRVIEQQGLVQSIGTVSQSGRVEYIATEQVNLRAGSQTIVKGGDGDVIDGGTIAAMATDPTKGTVTIEAGAVLDVSGGAKGGLGGEVWLGGISVPSSVSFLGTDSTGAFSGSLQTIPRTRTVTAADLAGGTARSYLNFYAMDDLTVNGSSFNLTSRTIAPALDGTARTGTLRFWAGNNLIVDASSLKNGTTTPSTSTNTINPWNLIGVAGNDILFQTPTGQSSLWSTGKGSITLQAGRDVKLVPDGGGGNTTIQTFDGDIAITAGRDLIAPSALNGNQYSGIRLDRVVINTTDPTQGAGNLYLTVGGNLAGSKVNGIETGPGFVLSNGTARVRVGGGLGSSSEYATFTVGSAGIVLGGSAPIANSQTTVALDVVAQGNIFVGNVQDRGLSEGLRSPTFNASTVNPNSTASFMSATGDIHLRPTNITNVVERVLSSILPSTFTASAPNGNVFIEGFLNFWSSPVGTLNFFAGQSIQGTSSQTAGITLYCPGDGCNPIAAPASQNLSPITLTTGAGDISGLNLHLVDSYRKTVNVSAAGNIRDVYGVFAVPDLGTGMAGNLIPAVSIAAKGNIDFSGQSGAASGFLFGGTGLARVTAGGRLDLGTSQGLVFQLDPHLVSTAGNVSAADQGGLLEIAVGGDLAMTQSKILSWNGASLFVHGLAAQAPVAGTTAMATSATLSVTTLNGQRVLAIGGQPVVGPDGFTPIPVNGSNQSLIGSPVYVVGGRAALDSSGLPIVVVAKDTVVGQTVLVVGGKPALGLDGKPIVVKTTSSSVISSADLVQGTAVLDRPPVQLADGTLVLVINGKTVYSPSSGTGPLDGRPTVNNGAVTLLVGGKSVNVVEPVGGSVNVGTNFNSVDDQTGILTVRGGAIDLKATGDVNVNLSRIATLGGGNITLTSTTGNINAGTGARTDVTNFKVKQPDPRIQGGFRNILFQVPGSGIFTYSPKDGNLPDIPPFNPISPFEAQVIMHQFLGHDVSKLEPLIPAAHEAWKSQYDQSVRQLFAGFKLGDITLKASHDVIVPPAGIRGRNITIDAGHNLELQGGEIRGISTVNVGSQVVGSLTGFVGAFVVNLGGVSGGSGTTLGLGNITGNVGSVTTTPPVTASAATSSITNSKTADDAKVSQPVNEQKTVSDKGGKKGAYQMPPGSLRIKDKVKIKVETKPEPTM